MKATGFTLIELVVALAVLSLLSLLVVQTLNLGYQAWDRGVAAGDRLDETETVQRSLRRELTLWLQSQDAKACGGSANELSFMAPAPYGIAAGQALRYQLSVASGALELQWCISASGMHACPNNDTHRESLLAGIQQVSFSYYGPGHGGNGGWSPIWNDCTRVPQLVRLDVQFAAGDHRRWPEFSVEPGMESAADCLFDSMGIRCRR